MFEGVPPTELHPTLTFALDLADKLIKLAAVALGGLWTWWNYRKSRTYAQKMELKLVGSIFHRAGVFIEIATTLKNLGASRHVVEKEGSFCVVTAICNDLSEQTIRIVPVFTHDNFVEPGESISDLLLFCLALDLSNIVWLRIDLQVVAQGVEWRQSESIRVEVRT